MSKENDQTFCKQIEKKYKKKGLKRPVYVIQKHNASRLHYDLRLEFDNKLKSWALPKSPPSKTNDKRLAIEVPDHPIEYAKFEGEIPEGNYGAGTVEIWDKGSF
nr:3'-phosphoesterase [Nitrosopumilaceae archaeon]NIU87923.1 3'-phosphoesterase [Nitrosopumilaceae archaeon]NIV66207.1 3'-phosphoesterase [Nitrosopumilaceae archaeon]NIX62098.1 3'-phosphoesterase [Nitrosopumilaceae archaeon]